MLKQWEISVSEFINSLNVDYTEDKVAFRKQMDKCFDSLFDVIDTNKDRSISEEECLIAFKAYGLENVELDTIFFKAYNPCYDNTQCPFFVIAGRGVVTYFRFWWSAVFVLMKLLFCIDVSMCDLAHDVVTIFQLP